MVKFTLDYDIKCCEMQSLVAFTFTAMLLQLCEHTIWPLISISACYIHFKMVAEWNAKFKSFCSDFLCFHYFQMISSYCMFPLLALCPTDKFLAAGSLHFLIAVQTVKDSDTALRVSHTQALEPSILLVCTEIYQDRILQFHMLLCHCDKCYFSQRSEWLVSVTPSKLPSPTKTVLWNRPEVKLLFVGRVEYILSKSLFQVLLS